MSPLFSATKTLPSDAKRIAIGRVRPDMTIVSSKPAAGTGTAGPGAAGLAWLVPLDLPKRRDGGASGVADEDGVAVGSAAETGGAMIVAA